MVMYVYCVWSLSFLHFKPFSALLPCTVQGQRQRNQRQEFGLEVAEEQLNSAVTQACERYFSVVRVCWSDSGNLVVLSTQQIATLPLLSFAEISSWGYVTPAFCSALTVMSQQLFRKRSGLSGELEISYKIMGDANKAVRY